MNFQKFIGIDFSGAKDAGRHIWMTQLTTSTRGTRVASVFPARVLSGASVQLNPTLIALREFICEQKAGLIGMDFPFSLPKQLIKESSWKLFLKSFPHHYLSPRNFRMKCREASPEKELKRVCDKEAKAPFSPYNLRVYRQTYYGIKEILAPLVLEGKISVPPFMPVQPSLPVVLETCPASYLKKIGSYFPYKGNNHREKTHRKLILKTLVERFSLHFQSTEDEVKIIDSPGGDPLDSLIAACILVEISRNWKLVEESFDKHDPLEGWVYF
ncbi:MAG: hypothetical protein D6748_09815 [Calditrichaeota bacterium]|nr:MAG: hypothetical protein D6748_09815 [Calditrichota bacterium]